MPAAQTAQNLDNADSTAPAAPENGPAAQLGLLDAVAGDLAATMPDVQEHAVAQAAAQAAAQNAINEQNAGKDKAGTTFDASLHQTGPDGRPVMTTKGTYALKRGRKAGGASSVPAASTMPARQVGAPAQASAPAAEIAQAQAARAAGMQAAELLFAAGVIIGGDEWMPRKDDKIGLDERASMQTAMANYFESTGKADLSPGMVLSFVMLAYAAPRFSMPKTQSRFQTVKAKIVGWWTNRKLRKMGLTAAVAPAGTAAP